MPDEHDIRAVYAGYEAERAASARWSQDNPGNRAIGAERDRLAERALRPRYGSGLASMRVLEIGCGAGSVLAGLRSLGIAEERMAGVDLLRDRIARARPALRGAALIVADASALPLRAASFDLAVCYTVFSSVLSTETERGIAAEIDRALAPGGAVLWYDIRRRNPFNPHTHPLRRRAIRTLFPAYAMSLRSVTLLPQLARRLGIATRMVYPVLASVPFLRTHYIGLLVKG